MHGLKHSAHLRHSVYRKPGSNKRHVNQVNQPIPKTREVPDRIPNMVSKASFRIATVLHQDLQLEIFKWEIPTSRDVSQDLGNILQQLQIRAATGTDS